MKICALCKASMGALAVGIWVAATVPTAIAAPINMEIVLSPKEQIRFDFADASKHFVLMVRREGTAKGNGPLAGTAVMEYGRHDIIPGVGGEPSGYLVFTATASDIAYVKWLVHAVFVPSADGKTMLLDNGIWEVAGGTGKFNRLQGAGTMRIKSVSPTDRNFILEGDLFVMAEEGKR